MSDAPIRMVQMEMPMSRMMGDVAKKEDLHEIKEQLTGFRGSVTKIENSRRRRSGDPQPQDANGQNQAERAAR